MSTEPLVRILDERYQHVKASVPWCIYRASTGEWIVMITDRTFPGETIEEALAKAVDYVPLPEIPRRPKELNVDEFEPRKSGKCWHLYYGDDFQGVLKSKRDCLKVAPKIVARSMQAALDWDAKYSSYLS